MWEINSLEQSGGLLLSVLLGAVISLLYDLLRIDRAVYKRCAFTIFVQDLLFWVVAAFLTFSLMLVTVNGQIRWYIFFGESCGFFAFRLLLSKILLQIIRPLIFLRRRITGAYGKFSKWLDRVLHNLSQKTKSVFFKLPHRRKRRKNIKNNRKKPLQDLK